MFQDRDGQYILIRYDSKRLLGIVRNHGITGLELHILVVNLYVLRNLFINVYFEVVVDHIASTNLGTKKEQPVRVNKFEIY